MKCTCIWSTGSTGGGESVITKYDINFLISLSDGWKKEIPNGMIPMDYVTLSYDGDMDIKKRFDKIIGRYIDISEECDKSGEKKAKGIKNWQEKLDAIE